ncbi:biotin transporter BioY [Pararhodobacter sp.]|uniref:biotin transporter BioY n=1 Tax=Pararhodobacter sp. TaxID=2127056 RepID=UPI002AFE7D6C|nr:biotin transporter BioY [Pararhodobacter sp.]
MAHSQTLVQASFGTSSMTRKALIMVAGSLLIALGAQISVPMLPVPMTLQTLAVLLVGFTAGSRLGAGAVLAYLAEGAVGLPVFSGGGAGAAWLVGPTGGFLFGFVAMAWAAGFLAERGTARGFVGTALSAVLVSALLYVPGVLWLTSVTPLDLNGAVTRGMIPFLLGDAVKAAVAALIVTGAWSALKNRRA